jgi:hypothetical protein
MKTLSLCTTVLICFFALAQTWMTALPDEALRDLALADEVARGAALDHAAGAAVSLATASKSIQFTPQRWPSRSSKLRPYMKS